MSPDCPVPPDELARVETPVEFFRLFWPNRPPMYDKQWDMVYGVRDSVETYCVACNKGGKDYISGFICTSLFVAPHLYFEPWYVAQVERRRILNYDPHSRRILTTSVKDEHLDVLWAEIAGWVRSARFPLLGKTLTMLHHEIRMTSEATSKNPTSYLKGQVSAKGEGLAGHHAAYTLGVGDEASGVDDEVYKQFQGWAKRQLYFGNPNPCNNFFRNNYELGDYLDPTAQAA